MSGAPLQAGRVVPLRDAAADACRSILGELPAWFGIPDAVEAYANRAASSDSFGLEIDGAIAGLLVMCETSVAAAEIHLIAVRPHYHRMGAGSQLVAEAVRWTRSRGRYLLTVKTLGPSRPNDAYDRTRRFYEALGFSPLEELHGLWPGNPCLFMVKVL